jgi:hypothetical protein
MTQLKTHLSRKITESLPDAFVGELCQRTYRRILSEGWPVGGDIEVLYSHYKLLIKGEPLTVTIATVREGADYLMVVGEEDELRGLVCDDQDSNWLVKFKGDKAQPEVFHVDGGGHVSTHRMVSDGAHRLETNRDRSKA